MRVRLVLLSVVTWLTLAVAPGRAAAQGAYTLRYEPGSRAAAVLDSLGFRQNAPRHAVDPRRSSPGTPALGTTGSATPAGGTADRRHADIVPFDNLAPGEGLVVVRRGVPPEFWRAVPGVIAVGTGSRVFPKGGLPDDPTFPQQWNLERIEAAGAWHYTTGGFTPTGRQIVIGVIEANGFDLAHPELASRYYRHPGEVPGNGLDDDGNGYVDDVTGVNFTSGGNGFQRHPHGVQVSGVLAAESNNGAQSAGLNWAAQLIPFQVDSVYKWALALDYLTTLRRRYNETDGAAGAYVVVANCSLGNLASCTAPANAELDAAIERAGRAGILVVGAVGNDTGDADRQTDIPASCPSDFLVTVTAADRADALLAGAGFSRSQVDLSAPGAPFGGLDYPLFGRNDNTFGQTSGATPQVAGTVALLYAGMCPRLEAMSLAQPGQVAALVRNIVLGSVDPVASQSSSVRSGGRLNARRAMEALQREGGCGGSAFVVGVDPGRAPPATLATVGGALRLSDTLSAAWGLYRYTATGADRVDVDGVRALAAVALAAEDARLVSAGLGYGFGGTRDYLGAIAQPLALGFVGSTGALPAPERPVAALFEIGFGESRPRAPGPQLNPFAPSLGIGGAALAGIAAEVAGADAGAELLNFRGYRLGDWVRAADSVAGLRRRYDAGAAPGGRRVVTFASGLDGLLDGGAPAPVIALVLGKLVEAGVIPVFPPDGRAADPVDDRDAFQEVLLAGGPLTAEREEAFATVLAPTDQVTFDAGGQDTRTSGDLAAVAQVTGGILLLSRLACEGAPGSEPRRDALELVAALLGADPADRPRVTLDLIAAARVRAASCSDEGAAGGAFVSVFPNPVGPQRQVRVIYRAAEGGEVSVFDVSGRRLATRPFPEAFAGVGQVGLTLDGLAAGVYVLRLTSGARVESTQIVVQ